MPLVVDKDRCPQSHRCPMISQCPVGAISQQGLGLPVIDADKCIECGKCKRICAMHAVYKVD
ncbi:MAG: 4Fe-4S binding protein [Muribaculaceae bacterium]|nr:4Fe-4S binding protein [Muribaculaceae bacterium]